MCGPFSTKPYNRRTRTCTSVTKKKQKTTDHTLFVHPFDSKDVKGNASF